MQFWIAQRLHDVSEAREELCNSASRIGELHDAINFPGECVRIAPAVRANKVLRWIVNHVSRDVPRFYTLRGFQGRRDRGIVRIRVCSSTILSFDCSLSSASPYGRSRRRVVGAFCAPRPPC